MEIVKYLKSHSLSLSLSHGILKIQIFPKIDSNSETIKILGESDMKLYTNATLNFILCIWRHRHCKEHNYDHTHRQSITSKNAKQPWCFPRNTGGHVMCWFIKRKMLIKTRKDTHFLMIHVSKIQLQIELPRKKIKWASWRIHIKHYSQCNWEQGRHDSFVIKYLRYSVKSKTQYIEIFNI